MMTDLSVLHEIATDRLARIRVITAGWLMGEFTFRTDPSAAHQALTRIIDVLNDYGDEGKR